MSEVILYEFHGCPFCRKVRAALRLKGMPFTRKIVSTTADYAELGRYNPLRQAPVLVVGGDVVRDSTDILHYIEARQPMPPLFPKDQSLGALCHFVEDWADESLSWFGSSFRWVDRRNKGTAQKQLKLSGKNPFARLFPDLGQFVGRLRAIGQGMGRKSPERLEAEFERHLSRLSDLLRGKSYFFGDQPSAADIAVWSQLRALKYCTQERLVTQHEIIGPFLDRMDQSLGDGE
jgi:glutathione S-transferase